MAEKEVQAGITVKKDADFSEWYTQIVQKCELADLRYNIKGFVCYLPWAVRSIKKMYSKYEKALEKTGHEPLIMPSLIPESNFKLEASHVKGFAPEVFWVTEAGNGVKFEERLALRPTSETALYKMYSLWVQSYKDLPFKRYQSCQVWRYEGKMTRPFFRGREFHWIEAHDVFSTEEDAKAQVKEDMRITYDMLEGEFAIPIIFFQRPEWDKFAGAIHTYAADALMKSGKVIQLPSTHLLGQNFSKPFGVKFKDKDGEDKYGYITCYGPAISRIYGAMIAILGDDKGLILPFDLAPVQIVVMPIIFEKSKNEVMNKCEKIKELLEQKYDTKIDARDDVSAGFKFNEWEMKGVPIRIEVGPKDIEKKQVMIFRRDLGKKIAVLEKDIEKTIDNIAEEFTENLKKEQLGRFNDLIVDAKTKKDVEKAIASQKIARCPFCSIDMDGEKCASMVEKEIQAFVRGIKADGNEKPRNNDKCVICGGKAKEIVYIAKSY
ncbi:proline--tRNA ligase [Candidatus Woesearchaeota archaeon]|nr:proline--tRNA ligase [Candidatus Woesearchaeota archaeon]